MEDSKKKRKSKGQAPAADDFYVPPVGKPVNPRRVAARTRLALASTGLVLSLGTVGIASYLAGASSRGEGALNPTSASSWHLDTYNVQSAASFGSRYLQLCLARHSTGDADAARQKQAVTYAAAPDPACGNGAGTTQPVTVDTISYAGLATAIPGVTNGRYLTFDAALSDGRPIRVTIPIYLTNPATGAGPRIIGNLGLVPVPALGRPEQQTDTPPRTDTQLGATLANAYLANFITSWAASESALTQYLAPTATEAARTGLYGIQGVPKITTVVVYPPDNAVGGNPGSITYTDGMLIQAETTVTFTSPTSQWTPYTASYRITLLRQSGHWFVVDINGGVGKVPAAAGPAPTPSWAPATPARPATPAPSTTKPS